MLIVKKRLWQLRLWSTHDVFRSALLGFLNPFLYYVVLFKAYEILPAQEVQSLNFVWPIVLVLFAMAFVRQEIAFTSVGGMVVSFIGVCVIATRGENVLESGFTDLYGVVLALSSAFIWAGYWLGHLKDSRDVIERLFVNFVFGCLFAAGYSVLVGPVQIPTHQGFLGCVYIGLFEMSVTFILWLNALQRSRTIDTVSGFVYVVPFLSLVFIHFTVGEPIVPSTIVGLSLIVAGIIVQRGWGRLVPLQHGS